MSAVDNRFDAFCARHFADRLDRSDLASDVDLVGHQNQTSARRYAAFESRGNLIEVFRWNGYFYQLQDQTLASLALPQSCQHASIILGGSKNLVTRLEIHSHQQNLERFRCIAGDGNLFTIAPKYFCETGPYRLRLRLEDLPHRVSGRVFLLPDVTHQRFSDNAGTG